MVIDSTQSDQTASINTRIDSAISDVNAELDLVSDQASQLSVAVVALDNDAVSVLASTVYADAPKSLHVGYKKITAADGTQYSVVAFIKSSA